MNTFLFYFNSQTLVIYIKQKKRLGCIPLPKARAAGFFWRTAEVTAAIDGWKQNPTW